MKKTRWICPVAYLYHNKKQIGKGLVSVYGNSVILLEPYNYNTIVAKAKIYVCNKTAIFTATNHPKAIGERIYIIKQKKNNQIYYKDIYFNNERK